MNDESALMRSVFVWGVPFVVVVAALGYETDWGRDVGPETAIPAVSAPAEHSLNIDERELDTRRPARRSDCHLG
jgi:membrane-bound lytic murein transglycosylase B